MSSPTSSSPPQTDSSLPSSPSTPASSHLPPTPRRARTGLPPPQSDTPTSPSDSSSNSNASPTPSAIFEPLNPGPSSTTSSSPTLLPPPFTEAPSASADPTPLFRYCPNPDADRAYLQQSEHDLVDEIQIIQKRLTASRQRQALQKNLRLLRRNISDSGSILDLATLAGNTSRKSHHTPTQDRPLRQRIISVSFRLPTVEDRQSVRQQLFDAALPPKSIFSLQKASDCPFVWLGASSDRPDSVSFENVYGQEHRSRYHSGNFRGRHDFSRDSLAQCIPVILPDEPEVLDNYHVFCEEILWPLLHYDYENLGDGADLDVYWEAYRIVNQRFAEAISEIYEDGDLIWVHNYHLLLLPSMLRESLWYAKIGFFLYTPFPSAELFRILPHRTQILKGIIGADMVGFHSYDYSKQFVASCSRLLGIEGTPSAIEADASIGRRCELGIYPAGIDVRALKDHVSSKHVKSRIAELRARFDGHKIVIGVDRLDDCFCGIPLKLLAFEQLLLDNPELVGKVILVQVAMIPRQARSLGSYRSQQMQVNEFVGRINSAFGTFAFSPVHYINAELDPVELHALMCVGHVCVVSTMRDGMDLVPHEWTVCQHGGNKGPLVLSEFSGTATSFSTALHVNPWDVDEVAEKIKEALDMNETARSKRNEAAYRFVTSHTAKLWGFNFLEDLEQCDRPTIGAGFGGTPLLDTSAVIHAYLGTSALPSPASSSTVLSSMNSSFPQSSISPQAQGEQVSGLLLNSFGSASRLPALSPEQNGSRMEDYGITEGYAKAILPSPGTKHESPWVSPEASTSNGKKAQRATLFVLDLDGTLVPFQAIAQLGAPSQHVLDVIRSIVEANPMNHVLITSSRDRNTLTQWLGDLKVYLAAEDGAFFRTPKSTTWISLFEDAPSHDFHHHAIPSGHISHNVDSFAPNVSETARIKNKGDTTGANQADCQNANGSPPPTANEFHENGDSRRDRKIFLKTEESSQRQASNSFASLSSTESAQNGDNNKANQSWKSLVLPAMQHFAERTPGVVIEEGDTSLTWHYIDSDTDFGRWQARDLFKHLESFLLQRLSVDLVADEGKRRWVKVRPNGVDKSQAVIHTIANIMKPKNKFSASLDSGEEHNSGSYLDFILCIGDDKADEGMFDLFRDESRMETTGVHCPANHMFTCRVGSSATSATSWLETTPRVLDLLEEIGSKRVLPS